MSAGGVPPFSSSTILAMFRVWISTLMPISFSKPIARSRKPALAVTAGVITLIVVALSATTIKVITPAVTPNAGLRDLAMGFEKEMGIKVEIQTLNMAKMVDELKGGTPPADIVFLPYALMD